MARVRGSPAGDAEQILGPSNLTGVRLFISSSVRGCSSMSLVMCFSQGR